MPGLHARFAPSSLAVMVACHAHMAMAEPYKDDPPTPESLEGDAAHWVNTQLVVHQLLPAVGSLAPNGVPVDEDMLDGARLWHSVVGDYGQSEVPVVIQRLHPTDCWGTPDWWRYDPIEGVLRVWDYKYGHLFVDAFEFWQGLAYAMGLIDMLGLPESTRIEIGIVQPRNYHPEGPVRKWSFDGIMLRNYTNQARYAIEKSQMDNRQATVGPHCDYCPARHECRTLQNAVMAGVSYVSGTMERVNLSPVAVATELRILDAALQLMEARRTGLQEQAMALIKGGKAVPGFAIEHPPGRLKWTKPAGEVFTLGDLMGVDLRKPAEPITPTQAIQRGMDKTLVEGTYAERPRGAPKLSASGTDRASKVFGHNG